MKAKKEKDAAPLSGFLLWQASNAWQRQIKLALAPLALTHVQYLLLETLQSIPAAAPMKQSAIADAAGIDVMMTSKVLRLLLKKKLVQRRSTRSDARAFVVSLTAEGKAVLEKARTIIEKTEDDFFAKVSKKKKFLGNLQELVG